MMAMTVTLTRMMTATAVHEYRMYWNELYWTRELNLKETVRDSCTLLLISQFLLFFLLVSPFFFFFFFFLPSS